ncbi:MAG TPA: VOC family protein [Steroidobacteraceae bacterium]
MRPNRSIPPCSVIPELGYPNVSRAINWLCGAFGFDLRLRVAHHRAQLNVGAGAIVVKELAQNEAPLTGAGWRTHAIMVRIADVEDHYANALGYGVRILREPADYPFGERQYTCLDLGDHAWTFSQTIADASPEGWGGVASR